MCFGVQLYRDFDAAISLLLFILEKKLLFPFIAFPVDAYDCPRRLSQEHIDPKTSYNANLSVFRARYLKFKAIVTWVFCCSSGNLFLQVILQIEV